MRQTEFDYVLAFWSEQTLKRFLFDLSWISSLLVAILELGSVDCKLCCVWSFFRHLVSISTFFTVYSLRCSCLSCQLIFVYLTVCISICVFVRSRVLPSVCSIIFVQSYGSVLFRCFVGYSPNFLDIHAFVD